MYVAEDLEAEQDEMDSSVGSTLGLLDASPAGATPKSVRRRVSGATGGRNGLKLRCDAHRKTAKASETEGKKSPRKLPQSSSECRRLLRNPSAEAELGQLSASADELDKANAASCSAAAESLDGQTAAAAAQLSSSEKRGSQRITRRNSDLKLAETGSVQESSSVQTELVDISDVASEDAKDVDMETETD